MNSMSHPSSDVFAWLLAFSPTFEGRSEGVLSH